MITNGGTKAVLGMRLGSLAAAYGAYRLVEDDDLTAGVSIGIGILLLGYAFAFFVAERHRGGWVQSSQIVIAIAALAFGLMRLTT